MANFAVVVGNHMLRIRVQANNPNHFAFNTGLFANLTNRRFGQRLGTTCTP